MKITICGLAMAHEPLSDTLIQDVTVLECLDGCCYGENGENIADYLDTELADIGIIGGTIRCSFSHSGGLKLWTDYWAPQRLGEDDLAKLVQYTISQWEDGIGESGFRFELELGSVDVFVSCEEKDIDVEQFDDGRDVPSPSQVAISARDGDLSALSVAIAAGEDIEGSHQGYSALHLAILYGNVCGALLLIRHGADVDRLDSHGELPLHLCATSSSLSDEQSTEIALELVKHGADQHRPSSTGDTAAMLAKSRGKAKLERALSEEKGHP